MLKFYIKITYNKLSLKWNPKLIKCALCAQKKSQHGGRQYWMGADKLCEMGGRGDQAIGGDSPHPLIS